MSVSSRSSIFLAGVDGDNYLDALPDILQRSVREEEVESDLSYPPWLNS